MSKQVNMHEAKTHFSKLAELVEHGEEVIIARAGHPVMKLVRIEAVQTPIFPGFASDLLDGCAGVDWQAIDQEVNQLFKDS
jgi:antitoxin (DNA-binding transcriptional repressor) of toxin-antitoxin stability system